MSLTSAVVPPVEAARPSRVGEVAELALRVLGGVISVVAAVLTAALEVLFATVRIGGALIGVSVLMAVVGNLALSWFAQRAVGARWALALPSIAWFAAMVVAAGGTTEGDVLLSSRNWVGITTIFVGVTVFTVIAFRMVLRPRR
ncbi:hypothetical protein SAMN05444365_101293 [Micromonospora pattaloongensis]|uniref:Uncharacterized protein n=1 Tax=Micromonospora pattaloongensis TaxID=405436 RepID=A0A1H3G7A6_9ACTN|nr:hypothetical protein [Micromonospora pattaloongensis]SDX98528.1 hypothetical protein SAMN05444365_101293 [Micromonospora pattaloongensis]